LTAVTRTWVDDEGCVRPPDAPGLGVDVGEAVVAKYAV
jgi:L-alanine-DL-glutamate epimerase-like enolase superfamily enzyme